MTQKKLWVLMLSICFIVSCSKDEVENQVPEVIDSTIIKKAVFNPGKSNEEHYYFDNKGVLNYITDKSGNKKIIFKYDTKGNLIERQEIGKETHSFSYNEKSEVTGFNNITIQTDKDLKKFYSTDKEFYPSGRIKRELITYIFLGDFVNKGDYKKSIDYSDEVPQFILNEDYNYNRHYGEGDVSISIDEIFIEYDMTISSTEFFYNKSLKNPLLKAFKPLYRVYGLIDAYCNPPLISENLIEKENYAGGDFDGPEDGYYRSTTNYIYTLNSNNLPKEQKDEKTGEVLIKYYYQGDKME